MKKEKKIKKEHIKKMIAPVLITFVLFLYFIAYFTVILWLPIPTALRLLVGVIPSMITGVVLFVLVERIKEIRSGEEDDLSEY